ncbi:hypothetical protein EVAR_50904_1 [Eumeta japonica]|uniref:Uncharacterized protein n=1 Tax=Eumeta variegata TaxID=151549 RepID=A0A4C1YCM8_EUMVA|nr:hypothetical protein EVAR_50904_1 [Eumeta japonica]
MDIQHEPKGATSAMSTFQKRIESLITNGAWATRTLFYWTKRNSGSCSFISLFCENVERNDFRAAAKLATAWLYDSSYMRSSVISTTASAVLNYQHMRSQPQQ